MKKRFLLILFIFIGNAVNAQGLSGNRFTVFYNTNYHGSIFGALSVILEGEREAFGYYNFKDDEKRSFLKSAVNLRHSLALNYILNKRTSVGLQFSQTRDAYSAGVQPIQNIEIPFSANYKCSSVEAEVRFYLMKKRGAIAPLGNFLGLRLGFSNVKTNLKISELIFNDAEEIRTDFADFTAPTLGVFWGRQFIFYKKIMMNVGMEFKHTFITEDNVQDEMSESVFDLGYESPKTRVYWNDFFRLTIGVGLAPL